jgi:hypothetical protein
VAVVDTSRGSTAIFTSPDDITRTDYRSGTRDDPELFYNANARASRPGFLHAVHNAFPNASTASLTKVLLWDDEKVAQG